MNNASDNPLFKDLYNGNIASWEAFYTSNKPSASTRYDNVFQYDYLNRLKYSKDLLKTSSSPIWTSENKYNSTFSYDANGNMTALERLNNGTKIDDFTYTYTPSGPILSNKLTHIDDAVINTAKTYDLDDQGPDNYIYDASGSLIQDAAGGVGVAKWTVDGKLRSVDFTDTKPDVSYLYDASGQRVMKRAVGSDSIRYTLYARDANGQVMAIYERETITETDNDDPNMGFCIDLTIVPPLLTSAPECTIHRTICYPDDLAYNQETGVIQLVNDIIITLPSGSPCLGTIYKIGAGAFINTAKFGGFSDKENERPDTSSLIVSLTLLSSTGMPMGTSNMLASAKTYPSVSNIELMPKLAEWHIYGNGEQGKFV